MVGQSSTFASRLADGVSRRGFLAGSALVAGSSTLLPVSGALERTPPARERWVEAPRWAGFRSVLRADDGFLLVGTRTNVEDEQVGWAVRLDDALDVRWNYTYQSPPHLRETASGEDHDGLEFALPDGAGGFLLVGWWHTLGSDSRYGWLTRVSADGIPRWSRVYNRDAVNSFRDDFAGGVRTDDGYLLVGRTIAGEFLDERAGDGWVAAVGEYGRVRWQRAYDPAGTASGFSDDDRHAEFTAVVQAGDGFLVVGEASPDGPTESTDTAAWAVRIDAEGDVRWSRTHRAVPGTRNEYRDVAATSDGFLVAGTAGSETSVRPLHDNVLSGRAWAARLDAEGCVDWQDAPGGEAFAAVEATPDGGVFAGTNGDRGWLAAYDDGGDRVDTYRSSVPESTYADLAATPDGFLAVGHGRDGGDADGLYTTVTDADLDTATDAGGDGADDGDGTGDDGDGDGTGDDGGSGDGDGTDEADDTEDGDGMDDDDGAEDGDGTDDDDGMGGGDGTGDDDGAGGGDGAGEEDDVSEGIGAAGDGSGGLARPTCSRWWRRR